ncbi:MAG: D-alanyl-D-alanine carboxypeptidase/D-alanyl-D-alanine-endopeptidase [Acidobacteria bacterium]|nr:D-alanyl-D-alanine carboxypeptidase/D-alanyl-D-alanine-endopeptidase [Acidobacteriota bacterium]
MRKRAIAVALVGALVGTGLPARAWVPEKTPRRGLESAVARVLSRRPASASIPAVLVRRGGRDLFALRAGTAALPASLMKLLTTTAALDRLGPGFRFATRVLSARRAARVPSLTLVGGGDPTLVTAAYGRENYLPHPGDPAPVPVYPGGFATVEQLADRVRAAGIRSVSGDLLVDESLFDRARTAPGWDPRYLRYEFDTGYLSALTVNEGFADPKRRALLPEPAIGAGEALRAALQSRGVRVEGRVVAGRAPARAVEIARVLSPPLSEIVAYVNRWSVNYPAELILKTLGARFGKAGSTAAGVAVVFRTLERLGIPLGGTVMADGSGLSLYDRLTPRAVASVLEHILSRRDPAGEALRASLPVAGGPGTLSHRMRRWPTRGNLRGKTGLVPHVRTMAGWVRALDGVTLVYVAIFNRSPRPLDLTGPLDELGLSLARYPMD